ncbi:MAG: hypothetical protein WCG80_14955 [Spirochaetales bacterium]
MRTNHRFSWEISYFTPPEHPKAWYPATVPGAAQLDVGKALGLPDPYFADQAKEWAWLEDVTFVYRTGFRRDDLLAGQPEGTQVWWRCGGIDYRWSVALNGQVLEQGEGMFRPLSLRLEHLQDDNVLEVTVFPVPKVAGRPNDRSQASASTKPAVSYGWDWHPRLIPSGLWDDAWFEVRPQPVLELVNFEPGLSADLSVARFTVDVVWDRPLPGGIHQEGRVRARLREAKGEAIWDASQAAASDAGFGSGAGKGTNARFAGTLHNPQLWWPHDQGTPYLYQLELTLEVAGREVDRLVRTVGFRRIRLVTNEGAWNEPAIFPKTRSVTGVQFEVNGRGVFAKGTNWVNPEVFPGTLTAGRYEELLDLAVGANFNIVRVWGGGIVNKEAFHDLCDQKGLLVWQEFPLACNNYPDEPAYLATLAREADAIVRRLRLHPSTALWCGGNELFNSWSGMDDQSLALRQLGAICLALDPGTPFLPTSPVMGMGHGPYVFRDDAGQDVFEVMNKARCTAYTEFGVPSPSSVAVLQGIIPADELWPPLPTTAWTAHHGFDSWQPTTWLMPEVIADYFGPADNLALLIDAGQTLQAEGYRYVYEEARRQKPYCSMALNWCFNEPWPCAANNSLVMYPAQPKPALAAVRQACRPVLASARYAKFRWTEGELWEAELWLLNDSPFDIPAVTVSAWLDDGERTLLATWPCPALAPGVNAAGPTVRWPVRSGGPVFRLMLEVDGAADWGSEYQFRRRNLVKVQEGTARMNQTETREAL